MAWAAPQRLQSKRGVPVTSKVQPGGDPGNTVGPAWKALLSFSPWVSSHCGATFHRKPAPQWHRHRVVNQPSDHAPEGTGLMVARGP